MNEVTTTTRGERFVSALLVFTPVVLFLGAVVLDTLFLINGSTGLAVAARWVMLLGLLTGLVGLPSAILDWMAMPRETNASTLAALYTTAKVLVLVSFVISWFMRSVSVYAYPVSAHVFSYIGLALAFFESYFGNRLIETPEFISSEDAKLDVRGLLHQESPPTDKAA